MLDTSMLDAEVATARQAYVEAHPLSAAADVRAREVMPGGNTRSVLHFDPFPFRVASAEGSVVVDIDGHRYVDFCGNYTAGLLGHSPPRLKQAIIDALDQGWSIGATHEREIELAELVCARFHSIDQVRFTNSGTEANLMAVGTALHHSGRTGVGVFDHGYHGGVLSFGPGGDSPDHPLNVPHRFVVEAFNDLTALDRLFSDNDLGCVLIEAVQGSGGCRPASQQFLSELARRCDEHGTVLILDEVMTSRLAPGGAQERFGITPHLTTLGKYLGGGMSFGAFGGSAAVMAAFDPIQGGELTQAGTFNNNVVSMAAAVATLRYELDPEIIQAVNARGDRLRQRLNNCFEQNNQPFRVTGMGSMLCFHADDPRLLELLFHHLLTEGIYVARRGFMALSLALTDDHIDRLVEGCTRWAADRGTTMLTAS
ncbi:MAG: glutamate-1-semialdehyde 2,1-aminomutase [Acidimicrobiales bacterium]|jgi:glutamate-1-semialdehyde 2,1-aminomutase